MLLLAKLHIDEQCHCFGAIFFQIQSNLQHLAGCPLTVVPTIDAITFSWWGPLGHCGCHGRGAWGCILVGVAPIIIAKPHEINMGHLVFTMVKKYLMALCPWCDLA